MSNNGSDIVGLGVISGYGEDRSESAWLALASEGGDPAVTCDAHHATGMDPSSGVIRCVAETIELAGALMGYERGQVAAAGIVSAAHPRLLDGLTPLEGGLALKTSTGMGGYDSAVVVGPVAAI